MKIKLENVLPEKIEERSFEIIESELTKKLDPTLSPIIKRVIHTTADFDYVDNLCFSKNAVNFALEALKNQASIVTDTTMVKAGINKSVLKKFGSEVFCFIQDKDVRESAIKNKTTRSLAAVDKAAGLGDNLIFAIGNAPTALIRLYELISEKKISPKLVIACPVGFVNVVQAKELIMTCDVPFIVAKGRKGGSNVAASICNALLYMLHKRE